VSSQCRLSPREELQILESEFVVTSTDAPKYKPEIHDEFSMAICFNRNHYLKARLLTPREQVKVPFRLPARLITSNWPYYQDNTVFGEAYLGMREVVALEGNNSWKTEMMGGDEVDAPPKGWLVVAVFHTLWSASCIKIMPSVHELVPIYQDILNFVSVKSDGQGLISISKSFNVKSFPTFVVLRGGKEVDRIEGTDRMVERLMRSLASNITTEDKACRAKYRHRLRIEAALETGQAFVEEETQERTGQLDWTFDPEQCGSSMKIEDDGMCVILAEPEEQEDEGIFLFFV
jgi:thioredoxin 1